MMICQSNYYGCIYVVTNILNNKVYVGQTVDTLSKRISNHFNYAFTKHSSNHFHRALRKYGKDAFSVAIFAVSFTKSELDLQEQRCIELYDAIRNGYNCREGGSHGKLSEETKRKISVALIGKDYVPSESRKRVGELNRGRKHSEDVKKRLSKAKLGSKNPMFGKVHPNYKLKKAITCSDGRKFESISVAAKEVGVTVAAICSMLKGRTKTCGGLTFKYDLGE